MNSSSQAQSVSSTAPPISIWEPLPPTCVHLTIMHFNDVYEITPVSGGALGGLARVATLRKQLIAGNPNTLLMFAGDLYNPSGLGTARVDGERLDGKQTVAVMNRVGVDYMTFGDHELDTVNAQQFGERLAATNFKMISSNVFDANGQPFSSGQTMVQQNDVFVVTNPHGQKIQVGIFGITKPIRLPQVEFTYLDWQTAVNAQIATLRDQVDILIALTHQPLATDQALSEQFPAIDLILGGDEHQHLKVKPAPDRAPIYKADSNARSVYIINLFYDTATHKLQIADRLQPITADLPDDPATLAEINDWVTVAFDAFRAEGWEPTTVLAQAPTDLDGFESTIRNRPTAFTNLITQSMMNAAPATELALICSWAIRLDDCIPAGHAITSYDITRTFPMGDSPVYAVEVPGCFLEEILTFGWARSGSGSYLLTTPNVRPQLRAGQKVGWLINDEPLDHGRCYQVAMADDLRNDYLYLINAERGQAVKTRGIYGNLYQALVDQLQQRKVTEC